jgi:GNAT superfamily N-acetyltransferase
VAVSIRPARLPDDKAAILSFIDGMQTFEHAIESDRRIDMRVAEEFFAEIFARVQGRGGVALLCEEQGSPVGWAVVYRDENEVYVHADERQFAYISELFVVEAARGHGIGKMLVAACEAWARDHGLGVVMINVLRDNKRAEKIYRAAGYETYYTSLRKYLR